VGAALGYDIRVGRFALCAALSAPLPTNALEDRVAGVVQGYDAQGNHRTATEGDNASAEWLAAQLRGLGIAPSLEPFPLDRVDPQLGYVRVSGRRIDGVPTFDAGFTDIEGVRGRLGPVGSDAEIGLTETEPSRLMEPGSERQRALLSNLRHSHHKAIVLLTRGTTSGLFLLNAPSFKKTLRPSYAADFERRK
jgi:hypothetical protein